MDEQTRATLIDDLDDYMIQAEKLAKSLGYLIDRHHLYQDKSHEAQRVYVTCNLAHQLVGSMREANDNLKRLGTQYIRETVESWYMALHYDMSDPIIEIAEEDVTPPEIESIIYKGNDSWEVIMQTVTHGRERVIIDSDGATWQQIYSSDKI